MNQNVWRVALGAALSIALGAGAAAPDTPPQSCATASATIDAAVARTLAQGSPGMVVHATRGDAVLFSRAYGAANLEHDAAMTTNTVFRLASVTKQFTAAAILLLAEDGNIRVEDRLSRYVPELPQAEDITLYQLLVQTSGLPDYADDATGLATKSVPRSTDEMIAWITSLQPRQHFAPGTRWRYSNSNYALLGAVIERVSRESLQEFFSARLFTPAGLERTSFDNPSDVVPNRADGYRRSRSAPSGFVNADEISWTIPGAAGGLRTVAGDLARWQDALFGARIVSRASLERMTAPGVMNDGRTTKFGMPEAWQAGLNADYGMGVFITPTPTGPRIWHSGDIDGFSTWLARYPQTGVTIALLQNSESAAMDKDAIEAAVMALVSGNCGR